MEDLLDLYQEEYDREEYDREEYDREEYDRTEYQRPVVCCDETSKQLLGDVRPPVKAAPGRVETRRSDRAPHCGGLC